MRIKQIATSAAGLLLGLALSACGGGGGTPQSGDGYSQLSFDIVTNPGSSVQSAGVTGKYADMTNPAFAWVQGQLPAGSTPIAGMSLSPATPQGSGFSGILSATLDSERGTSSVWAGQYADVYAADLQAHTLTKYSVVQTSADGRFNLPLNFLGFLVFASSQTGGGFTVAAFADEAATSTGTTVNFHAVATGGVAPITYTWDFGDTHGATGDTAAHAYAAVGSYNVLLQATDAAGNVAPATSTPIDVSTSAPPLTGVTVVVTPGAVNSGQFSYDATATGGLAPLSFFWDFAGAGSGVDTATTATGSTTHTFATPGLYTGTVTVTDALGVTASAPIVSDARPEPVITGLSEVEGAIGDKLTLTGNHFATQDTGDSVTLGGVSLPIDTANGGWTDTSIAVTLPAGVTNGNIVVHKVRDSNAMAFVVIPGTPGTPGGGQF
jgi:hypothetical protein